MDHIRRPRYSGPMFPLGSHSGDQEPLRRFRGIVVGIRPGRIDDTGTTRILTIRLLESNPEAGNLLNADVELLVHSKP
jgi:hypothetical protein